MEKGRESLRVCAITSVVSAKQLDKYCPVFCLFFLLRSKVQLG
jgi:hypothetical protein